MNAASYKDDPDDCRFEENQKRDPHILLTIVSAHYRPSEGIRQGGVEHYCQEPRHHHPHHHSNAAAGGTATAARSREQAFQEADPELSRFSRDVTPHLRALVLVQQYRETSCRWPYAEDVKWNDPENDKNPAVPVVVSSSSSSSWQQSSILSAMNKGGMKRTQIRVFDGGMNSVFGDPCPGTSKRLFVNYTISKVEEKDRMSSSSSSLDGGASARLHLKRSRAASSEVHHMVFAEHEAVVLRRQLNNTYRGDSARASQLKDDSTENAELEQRNVVPSTRRLPPSVYEILLPLCMPFLQVKERVQCQLVCNPWRSIVRQWGIATTINIQDDSFLAFTRPLLRGLVSHSFSSLHSLFLGGMADLEKSDLNPSIPHLKVLRCLDVSYCRALDDETLHLLSLHCKNTLRVLYLKGLRQVTDAGFIQLCRGCTNLQVLDVSLIPITDLAGMEIGRQLVQLQALFLRDNYQLTSLSTGLIASNCTQLEQLTLWGCTRLHQLQSFHSSVMSSSSYPPNLTMLNLWGCHRLKDDLSLVLASLTNLRSLTVSECHLLTDQFMIHVAHHLPSLRHFWLRYCKRITDAGILSIAHNMFRLESLDLTLCNRITITSISELLLRVSGLSELRLVGCKGLDLVHEESGELNRAGQELLRSFRRPESHLSVLDVAHCTTGNASRSLQVFVVAMESLGFVHHPQGCFSRPARCTLEDQKRRVEELLCQADNTVV